MGIDLETIRDVVIILYGLLGLILMLVLVIAAVGLWFAVRSLVRQTNSLLLDPIKPTLDEAHKSVQNVRAATEFVADSAVHPVIRIVSVGRGIKRAIAILIGLGIRRSGSEDE